MERRSIDSLLEGYGNSLDLFGSNQRIIKFSNSLQSDSKVLENDWKTIGDDLKKVMENEQKRNK